MLGLEKGRKLGKYIADYVVFDLETTGISAYTDEIIEIAAVKVRNGKVVDEFTTLVNPGMHIPAGASAVNGITDRMVKDAPTLQPVMESFLSFIEDLPLVGHNIASFDMKFIYRAVEEYWGKILSNDYLDTLYFARKMCPGLPKYRLVDLAEYYHISPEGAHRALNDCRMNQKVFELLGKERKNSTTIEKICPRCGETMQRRNGRYGEFWGCSGYPGCRYTENI